VAYPDGMTSTFLMDNSLGEGNEKLVPFPTGDPERKCAEEHPSLAAETLSSVGEFPTTIENTTVEGGTGAPVGAATYSTHVVKDFVNQHGLTHRMYGTVHSELPNKVFWIDTRLGEPPDAFKTVSKLRRIDKGDLRYAKTGRAVEFTRIRADGSVHNVVRTDFSLSAG